MGRRRGLVGGMMHVVNEMDKEQRRQLRYQERVRRENEKIEQRRIKEELKEEKLREQQAYNTYIEHKIRICEDDNESIKDNEEFIVKNYLFENLNFEIDFSWDDLKKNSSFSEKKPKLKEYKSTPPKPSKISPSIMPNKNDEKYLIPAPFFNRLFLKTEGSFNEYLYDEEIKEWKRMKNEILKLNKNNQVLYEEEISLIAKINKDTEQINKRNLDGWNYRKEKYHSENEMWNVDIDNKKMIFISRDKETIEEYFENIVFNIDIISFNTYSSFPGEVELTYSNEFELEYNPKSKILIVDYQLPLIDYLPKIKKIRYIKSRDTFEHTTYSSSELRKLYERLLYQQPLIIFHHIFSNDEYDQISSVVFNGFIKSIDPGSGKKIKPYIMSIQAPKEVFSSYDLEYVDPKACFNKLKGVSCSKLETLTPIPPILKINRDDNRFVDEEDVISQVNSSENLAMMDWKDFEHLIRGLFEKVFSKNGGEVKVTQASRDGGVDAIAFDPDPIRGGKIVIQAKRYTNTVSVSAVRDLFGTIINEGATKGILITTSDYGPDAYSFSQGKPITLLNGGHLLHLLEEHGHQARINISEAKEHMRELQ